MSLIPISEVASFAANVSWSEVISSIATTSTALVAFSALRNWKRQDIAKRRADFLDELIDATHDYILEMRRVVGTIRTIEIGFEAHIPIGETNATLVDGAIKFIEAKSENASNMLRVSLEACQPKTARLQSLSAKGQIFKFENLEKYHEATTLLLRQFHRSEAVLAVIHSPSWNWEHPEVKTLLKNMVQITADDLNNHLNENNVALIAFCQENYRQIFK